MWLRGEGLNGSAQSALLVHTHKGTEFRSPATTLEQTQKRAEQRTPVIYCWGAKKGIQGLLPVSFFSHIYAWGTPVCMHIHMHGYICKRVCAQVCAHAGKGSIRNQSNSLIWTVSAVTFQGWNCRRATMLIWHLCGFEESKFLSSRLLASALVAGLAPQCSNSIFQRYN